MLALTWNALLSPCDNRYGGQIESNTFPILWELTMLTCTNTKQCRFIVDQFREIKFSNEFHGITVFYKHNIKILCIILINTLSRVLWMEWSKEITRALNDFFLILHTSKCLFWSTKQIRRKSYCKQIYNLLPE